MSQRPQVRPATEGWKQKLDEKTGKPLQGLPVLCGDVIVWQF